MISYMAALLAAVANASSNVLNRKATREEPAQLEFRVRLILDLLQRRTWLIAVAIMLASFVLSAVALGSGQLAAVQIIIILELPMTLVGASRFLGGHLGWRDRAAIAGMVIGVAGVLVCLDPRSGGQNTVPADDWLIGSAISAGIVAGLYAAARKTRNPVRRTAVLGVTSGLGYGLAAAFTKGMTLQYTVGGISAVIKSWPLYAAALAGAVSTWLLQNAYHAGKLAAAQPGITLADPLQATIWGVAVFGEHIRGGASLAVAVLPLAALTAGVFVLSRSPSLQAPDSPGRYQGPSRPGRDRT